MKCVVIGGSGFLGGAIVDELIKRGDQVISADKTKIGENKLAESEFCDLTISSSIRRVVDGAEEVYLIAGVLGTAELDECVHNAVEINIVGAINVLNACVESGVEKLFFPSKPNPWLNTYTITKIAAERFMMLYHERHDLNVVVMRWFNAYGPRQHTHPVRKFLPTFCLQARVGNPLTIFGTGENTCDVVFSRDIAKWSVEAMRVGLWGHIWDFGRGIEMTVNQIAADVLSVADRDVRYIKHIPMRKGEIEGTSLIADIGDLRKAFAQKGITLSFSPWMETLKETYLYYERLPLETLKETMDRW